MIRDTATLAESRKIGPGFAACRLFRRFVCALGSDLSRSIDKKQKIANGRCSGQMTNGSYLQH